MHFFSYLFFSLVLAAGKSTSVNFRISRGIRVFASINLLPADVMILQSREDLSSTLPCLPACPGSSMLYSTCTRVSLTVSRSLIWLTLHDSMLLFFKDVNQSCTLHGRRHSHAALLVLIIINTVYYSAGPFNSSDCYRLTDSFPDCIYHCTENSIHDAAAITIEGSKFRSTFALRPYIKKSKVHTQNDNGSTSIHRNSIFFF